MSPKTKKWLMLTVGCAVTLVSLWYSTRQVNFPEMVSAIRAYKMIWIVPAFFGFYFGMYLRAVRWGLLFEPHHHVKGTQVFRPLMICFAFNSILPARVGEVVRAVMVGKQLKTGLPTALATVVAERILDAVTLLSCLMISLHFLPPIDPSISYTFGSHEINAKAIGELLHHLIELCAVMVVGAIVFMIPAVQLLAIKIVRRLTFLPHTLRSIIEKIVMQFAQGFHAFQEPWVLAKIVFHSVVIWLLVAAGNAAAARGFGFQMSLIQGMALMTLIGIFILIPAAPGYWGLYEIGAVFSLRIMGIGANDTERWALALVLHLLQYVPIVIWGMYYAWRAQVKPTVAAGEITNSE